MNDQTFLAQLGTFKNPQEGSMSTPIYTSTAYSYGPSQEDVPTYYSRTGNGTRDILQEAIAFLERGRQGFATASGMAAIALAIESCLMAGDNIVTSNDLYGGTLEYFRDIESKNLYNITYAVSENELIEQMKNKTDLVYLETPSNPMMTTFNIKKISEVAKQYGVLVVIDNTFYTPLNQKPLELGADIVLHSATKYISGHHDVIAGLVVAKDEDICNKLNFTLSHSGSVLSPIDSWLVLRGMKTLAIRMKYHQINAKEIIDYIKNEEMVSEVFYGGKGGVFSFKINNINKSEEFCKALNNIAYAVSLGGTETTITIPSQETHIGIDDKFKSSYGLDKSIIRISVGLEDAADIVEDLKQAFDKIR